MVFLLPFYRVHYVFGLLGKARRCLYGQHHQINRMDEKTNCTFRYTKTLWSSQLLSHKDNISIPYLIKPLLLLKCNELHSYSNIFGNIPVQANNITLIP